MRILFLTPFLPDPEAHHGGGSYLGALARGLSRRAELALVHLQHPHEVGDRSPAFAWQNHASFQGDPRGVGHLARMLWRWRNRPLLVAKYWQPQVVQTIAQARREFSPDIALVEMAQMAQYLPFLEGLPTILTDHEAGRPANASTGNALADRRDDRLWRRFLRRHYPMADQIQALTTEDATAIARQVDRDVALRPPALEMPAQPSRPERTARRVLFLGNYRHQPNAEAAHRLAREIWPLVVRDCPDAELVLAGANHEPIATCAALPNVQVTGFVADLDRLLTGARAVLAPLWSGAGFRVKNATALAHGVPVVTNELGARGCRAPAPGCTIAETPRELADATLRLLRDEALAARAGQIARSWAIEHYDIEQVCDRQLQVIDAVLARRSPAVR